MLIFYLSNSKKTGSKIFFLIFKQSNAFENRDNLHQRLAFNFETKKIK